MTDRCAAKTCNAPVQWARNIETGKGVPIDPDPVPDGNIVIVPPEDYPDTLRLRPHEVAVHYLKRADDPGDRPRYVSHFVTCPEAKTFRKRT